MRNNLPTVALIRNAAGINGLGMDSCAFTEEHVGAAMVSISRYPRYRKVFSFMTAGNLH